MPGLVYYYHFYLILRSIQLSHANSADPDQTPRVAASDLGLHCLLKSLFGHWT